MAAVGAEVTGSYFLSSGVVGVFILLLLLSIFLTALCSECSRRSFELRDSEDKNPSALIRVVKLEEAMVARENPMIDEIQIDEKEVHPAEGNTASFTPWRSHLGAPLTHSCVNGSTPADSDHIVSSPATPHGPGGQSSARSDCDGNSVYAQVSKRVRPTTPPAHAPEEGEEEEEEEEEEEPSPPLPDRKTQLEG